MSPLIIFLYWVRFKKIVNNFDFVTMLQHFRRKIFIWSVYVQDLSFGFKSSGYDSIVSAKRFIRNSRGSMECLSVLSDSHNGKRSFQFNRQS